MKVHNREISLKIIIPVLMAIYYGLLIMFKDNLLIQKFISNILSIIGSFISFIFLFYTYQHTKGCEKYYWLLLSLGIFSYTIGEVVWLYYDSILHLDMVNPRLSDIFYLIQYPLCIAGVLYLASKTKNKIGSLRLLFDTLIVITIAGTMILYYNIQSMSYKDISYTPYFFILTVNLIGDLGLVFSMMYLSFISHEVLPRKVVYIGAIGFLLEAILDAIYLYTSLNTIPTSVIYLDPLWMLSLLIVALSGEVFQITEVTCKKKEDIKINTILALLPHLIVIVLLIVMFFKLEKMDTIMKGFIFTSLFITIREILTIVENDKLLKLLVKSNEELEIANKELQKFYKLKDEESKTDFLTGLYNRRYIDEKFEELVQDCNVVKNKMSVLMVDIDHFKIINDTYGHDIGDVVLKHVSQIMKNNIRSDDILIRFGGEEFICFLPNTNINTANIIAERLRKQIEEYDYKNYNIDDPVTVSIGISELNSVRDKEDIASVIVKADEALYEAKKLGRNCVFYEE